MKQLILIRHAKSGWDDLSARDCDRDLNDRGRMDAPVMAARLLSKGVIPDAMLVSSARRARVTAGLIISKLDFPPDELQLKDELYLASAAEMLRLIRQTPDHVQNLALVGHNPGITELTNRLARTYIHNIPTCGIALMQLPIEQWQCAGSNAELVDFDYPNNQEQSRLGKIVAH